MKLNFIKSSQELSKKIIPTLKLAFTKKKGLIILLFMIIVTIGLAVFSMIYVRNVPKPQYFMSTKQPVIGDSVVVDNKTKSVEQMPSFSYVLPSQEKGMSKAREAAQKLGIDGETFNKATGLYVWRNQQWLFTYSLTAGTFSLQDFTNLALGEQKIGNAQMYAQMANNFLSDNFGFDASFDFEVNGFKYLNPNNPQSAATPETNLGAADVVNLSSPVLLDKCPVYMYSDTPAAVLFSFKPDGQIVSANIPWSILNVSKGAKINVPSLSSVVQSINRDTGNAIIFVNGYNPDTHPKYQNIVLKSLTLEKVTAGYYFNATPSETHFFPVYNFGGQASDGRITYQATVLVKM